jgi:hypothetical protein
MQIATKWALVLAAIVISSVVAAISAEFVAQAVGLWSTPASGFCGAFVGVLVAYLAAPSQKMWVAITAFVVGAVVAWHGLEPAWYPQGYGENTYQPTHFPVIVTYLGGILGIGVSLTLHSSGPADAGRSIHTR